MCSEPNAQGYGALAIDAESEDFLPEEDINKPDLNSYLFKFCYSEDFSVVANLSNALLGVGIFAMPWGFLQSGVVGGCIILTMVALLSFETARILLSSQKMLYSRSGEVKSYPEMAVATLGGETWGTVVKCATVISCLGGCIGYLIFLGEISGQLFQISLTTAVLMAMCPLILLSWIRSFRELTIFTLLGNVAIFVAVIMVTISGAADYESDSLDTVPFILPVTSLNFLGPATFLFTIHYCVLSMGAECLTGNPSPSTSTTALNASHEDNSSKELTRALRMAYALSSLLIILHGCSAYILYRNADFVT